MRYSILYSLLFFIIISCAFPGYAQNSKRRTAQVLPIPTDTALYNKAKRGDADAQAFVGLLYYDGEGGVPENDTEALRWFRKSNDGKSPYGKYWLGVAYSNGIGCTNRELGSNMIKQGVEELRSLAERNDSLAQYWLGYAYKIGNVDDDGEEDYKNAFLWFERSAENGYLESYCEAADCLKTLYGSKNKKAFDLLKIASDKGYPRAQYEFSQYYFLGLGVPQSYEEELNLLIKSVEGGYENGAYSVAEHYEMGFGTELNIAEAINWYTRIGANYKLGCFYRDGVGVDRNFDTAIRYFSAAAKDGDDEAKMAIKDMQKKGRVFYSKLPKRNPDDYYILKEGDPFLGMRLSANWDELNEYTKAIYLRHFKEEKYHEWGDEIANKVANHAVEIGFSKEQLSYSQGFNYETRLISIPHGNILVMKYPHCTYFLIDDKLEAMIWGNGMQVGDTKLIETYAGDYVITNGNQ